MKKIKLLEDLMKRFSYTLAILALTFMYSCFSQDGKSPEPAAGGPTPKIEIVGGDTYDWKDVIFKQNTPLTAKVKIRNAGDAILILGEPKTSCGCTTAPLDKDTLQPGEEATLNVTLRIQNRSAAVSKTVTLNSNDPVNPRKILYLKANVTVPVEVLPREYFSLSDMKIGFETISTVSIKNNTSAPIKILDYTLKPDNASVDIVKGKVIKPGESMPVTLKVKPNASGKFNSNLDINTNNPDYPVISIRGSGNVQESELFNNSNTSEK